MQETPTVQQPIPPQQPPMYPPPTYQPSLKPPLSNKRLWLILGIVAAILLLVGGFIIGDIVGTQGQTTTTPSAIQPTQQATTQPTPVTRPTQPPVTQTHTIGKPYDVGYGWTVTLNSVHVSMGDQYYGPKPGHRFIVVNVSIKNQGTQTWTVIPSIFQLRDSTGQGYHGTFDPSSSDAPQGQLLPGHVIRGDMVFEVPGSEKHVVFLFVPISHPDALTEWPITVT